MLALAEPQAELQEPVAPRVERAPAAGQRAEAVRRGLHGAAAVLQQEGPVVPVRREVVWAGPQGGAAARDAEVAAARDAEVQPREERDVPAVRHAAAALQAASFPVRLLAP